MMHTYPVQLEPEVIIGTCSAPTGYAMTKKNHVIVYCIHGHVIKGRIYLNSDIADSVARRMNESIAANRTVVLNS